jgi:ribosome assembly protein SQT1
MMEEDDDENVEEADQFDEDGNPVVNDDEMVELHDDSVQGFFAHKGTEEKS